MRYQNFEDVNQLDTDAQRNLLEAGQPREKLWAAWSLGLHSDPTLKPQLLTEVNQGVLPGLRAKFVTMLAGLGERSALETLAKYDDDEFVREAACLYLLQTAAHDRQLQDLLIERLLQDESAIVRTFIFQQAIHDFPLLNRPALEKLLTDDDEDIRAAAFGLASQVDYRWTLQQLSIESGLQLVYEAFFKWVLWKTGYERFESAERMAAGLGMAWMFYQRLYNISTQVPEVDIFERAGWLKRKVVVDSSEAALDERKAALVSRLRELEKEPGLDFLTEIFVGWASGFPNSQEIIFELGKRMYYAT